MDFSSPKLFCFFFFFGFLFLLTTSLSFLSFFLLPLYFLSHFLFSFMFYFSGRNGRFFKKKKKKKKLDLLPLNLSHIFFSFLFFFLTRWPFKKKTICFLSIFSPISSLLSCLFIVDYMSSVYCRFIDEISSIYYRFFCFMRTYASILIYPRYFDAQPIYQ